MIARPKLRSYISMLLLCGVVSIGYSPDMSTSQQWSEVKRLKGWEITRDYSKAKKQSHLKRHPKHASYFDQPPLSGTAEEAYDQLNLELHEKIQQACLTHFANYKVPSDIRKARGKSSIFSPFTYQNFDWYSPSYECFVVIITDYISPELLGKLQSLLQDEHSDWFIGVIGSNSIDFDDDYELGIFSDKVIVSPEAARELNISKDSESR